MFKNAAEQEGYILASPNHINDTISLSENMLRTGRTIESTVRILPVNTSRIYVAGFSNGGRFANITPFFLKNINGIISCGASVMNPEMLSSKNRFHFIGVVGKKDFNYTELLKLQKILHRLKFQNQLIVFDGGQEWPNNDLLHTALMRFNLSDMAKGAIPKDSVYVQKAYDEDLRRFSVLRGQLKLLIAEKVLDEMLSVYRLHQNTDSLKELKKNLRKERLYRALKRNENAALFKESLLKEDYLYYLDEDVLTYNYNNLGWWNYQMSELDKFIQGGNTAEKAMGHRLFGFVNALIEDNIDLVRSEKQVDEEALLFLNMLKTITEPTDFDHYLKVISLAAKNEDFGTAIFYLEEALKKGFKDKEKLYAVEHTALLRITPEFNKVVEKYLKDARYEVIEE
ncbi:alpha/beta hydrolase [Allomuricauda sp. SCSIO 65647]|uniref:alpha/beta hydrolase n=1 Tax=Allomuricauda sp. SCSIO 65647 TaxID=2908843 RepID=UPI001F1BB620|nr:alpha/beta hydrolase [Muricauda sp. SCSIO 65647]UJH66764.1 alpha/beta hydrolase [Muricauda sp. SCSIO 65647]